MGPAPRQVTFRHAGVCRRSSRQSGCEPHILAYNKAVHRIATAVAALALSSCSGAAVGTTGATSTPALGSPQADIPGEALPQAGGCGSTTLYRGPGPAWLDEAGGHNNPTGLRYGVAHPPIAAAFIFGYPLRAGHPSNPTNKILWVVRRPRNGSDLFIQGRFLNSATFTIHDTRPADSGPGEIYPDGEDVPAPGCWVFVLHWSTQSAEIELEYR